MTSPLVKRLLAAALSLALLGACGTPCGNLWKRLQRCEDEKSDKKTVKSKSLRRAFLQRCKKSDKSKLKSCLKLESCEALRRCAGRLRK